MLLESISGLVAADLKQIDHFMTTQLESRIPLIGQVVEYILACGGKRIRPIVLLLSAKSLNYRQQRHIELAAVVELIHTATLLHDDVVDNSTLRRGHKTANMIWGNEASVLIGDFLYSRAFQVVVDMHHQTILDIFAKATHFIAEGEILQLTNCHNPDTKESFYFDIIERKTAKLFEVAAHLGALLGSQNLKEVEALASYGFHLGLAYQLIDDALDYSQTADETGKNVGQDIAEGKTTLPLIYAMQQSHGKALRLIKNAITKGSSNQLDAILSILESTQAIKYTAATAKKHAAIAKQALQLIAPSPYRDALQLLSDFVVERTY